MNVLHEIAVAAVWTFVGLWIGWRARGRQRPPVVAPIDVRDYIAKRIANLREVIIEGTGYVDKNRARLAELESLDFEISRGDKSD